MIPTSRCSVSSVTSRVVLLALGLASASHAGPTSGFPGLDADRESTIFGSLLGDIPGSVPATAHGTWRVDSSGLSLESPAPFGDETYWLPSDPAATFSDGLARARIHPGSDPRIHLLVRASPPPEGAHPDEISGYGVQIRRNSISIDRWDRGLMLPIGVKARIPGLSRHETLEVTFFAAGSWLVAMVWDGETLDHLGTVVAQDARHPTGQIGLRANKRQNTETRVSWLSASGPSRAHAELEAARASLGLLARSDTRTVIATLAAELEARPIPAPFGPDRLVYIRRDDAERVPSSVRTAVLPDAPAPEGQIALYFKDEPSAAARLRRAKIEPLSIRDDVPWWAKDADYRAQRLRGIDRTPRGMRIDASYKNPRMVEEILRGYAERFPSIAQLHELGTTHEDRPILALKISDNAAAHEDEPAMLLNSAHHGSELLSIEYTLDAIQQLLEGYDSDPKIRRYVDELEIWCVPLVNPDGNHTFTEITHWAGRKNGRDTNGDGVKTPWEGVDLNRNYPFRWGALGEVGSRSWPEHYWYRGTEPASEPETRAMMALANAEHFAASISYHTVSTAILSPYTIDDVTNPTPDEAWDIAEAIARRAGTQASGKPYRVLRKLYSVDGVDQDWFRHTHGTLAFLVEGSHHNPVSAAIRKRSVERNRPTWRLLFDRYLEGPSLSGHVRDQDGGALEAVVAIREIVHHEGERWTSRARDGRFDRFLPATGTYTVIASAPGYETVTRRVVVGNKPVTVDLTLRPSADSGSGSR